MYIKNGKLMTKSAQSSSSVKDLACLFRCKILVSLTRFSDFSCVALGAVASQHRNSCLSDKLNRVVFAEYYGIEGELVMLEYAPSIPELKKSHAQTGTQGFRLATVNDYAV